MLKFNQIISSGAKIDDKLKQNNKSAIMFPARIGIDCKIDKQIAT